MTRVEQNRYKTNNGCIKHLPQTGKKDNGKAVKHEQKMLAFLANEMDKAGRGVEAHVVRTIVKPHVKEMRKDWEKMTPVQKYVAAEKKFFK